MGGRPLTTGGQDRSMSTKSNAARVPDDVRSELVQTCTAMFVRKGFDRTTTRELSRALQWSKGRLYQWVGSRDDLMHLLIEFFVERDDEFKETATELSRDLDHTETLKTAMRLYVEKNDRYQDLYRFMTHISANLGRVDRQRVFESARKTSAFFEEIVTRGVEAGEFRTNNAELVAWNIVMLGDWAMRRYFFKRRYSVDEFISEQSGNILLQLGVEASPVVSKAAQCEPLKRGDGE